MFTKQTLKEWPLDFEAWLTLAMKGLAAPVVECLAPELRAHYENALEDALKNDMSEAEAKASAVKCLGDPVKQNKRYKRIYLSAEQLKHPGEFIFEDDIKIFGYIIVAAQLIDCMGMISFGWLYFVLSLSFPIFAYAFSKYCHKISQNANNARKNLVTGFFLFFSLFIWGLLSQWLRFFEYGGPLLEGILKKLPLTIVIVLAFYWGYYRIRRTEKLLESCGKKF